MVTLATIQPQEGISLRAEPLRLEFEPSGGTSAEEFLSKLGKLEADRQFYVVFEDLRVDVQPGVAYSVYLVASTRDAFRGAADPRYIGALQFFGAASHSAPRGTRVTFNVTERIRVLAKSDAKSLALWIVPSATPEKASSPHIKDIQLVFMP